MNVRHIISSILFESTSSFFMWLPSLHVRRCYLRLFLGGMGKGNYIARNIDIREPHNIHMGNHNVINKHVVLDGRGGLTIGNNVDIAQDTQIWTYQHDKNDSKHGGQGKPVIISDYSWIAARVTILPGVTIGKGAVLGANAVVTRNVSEMAVVAGNPAKVVSQRENDLNYTLDYRPLYSLSNIIRRITHR